MALLIKRGSTFVVFHPNFDPHFYTTTYRKNEIRIARNAGKKGRSIFQGPRASGPPCNYSMLESLYKMQVEKVGRIEILVACLRSRDNIRRQETCD